MGDTVKIRIFDALKQQVPANAVQYCWDLWKEAPFHFVIARKRTTKLGDFRFRSNRDIQVITINYDLNPYQFLITYVHEVAHHRVYQKYSAGVRPHGMEWKRIFQDLMSPLLSDLVFPKDILLPLKRHMSNPKASSGADFFLTKELSKYDIRKDGIQAIYLGEVKKGTTFNLKGRLFRKLETRRTRVLCLEINSGKKYLISEQAEIFVAPGVL